LDAVTAIDQSDDVSSLSTGVTAAAGFRASGTAAGIKPSGDPDMALLVADTSVPTVAVFTRSLAAAPPVELDRGRLASGTARAVIVNSGCANAATGAAGMADAEATTAAVAEALGCEVDEVLVCSTGVIGTRLPMDVHPRRHPRVGGPDLDTHPAAGEAAAQGIMTTDSVPKQAVAEGDGWVIGGMSKGAGMIRPDMATMLAFLTTDAVLDATAMQPMLTEAVATTFNCLNIDGCQSTNDTVILMASGSSGVTPDPGFVRRRTHCGVCRPGDADGDRCRRRLQGCDHRGERCRQPRRRPPSRDAGGRLGAGAIRLPRSRPQLGPHPRRPRCGGVPLDQGVVEIRIAGTTVCSGGVAAVFDDDLVSRAMTATFEVEVVVGDGPGAATVVTTDLTPDYVRFNGTAHEHRPHLPTPAKARSPTRWARPRSSWRRCPTSSASAARSW
jgi:glutamate N-acetyltransferase / amino-acid N-acetyltransferase